MALEGVRKCAAAVVRRRSTCRTVALRGAFALLFGSTGILPSSFFPFSSFSSFLSSLPLRPLFLLSQAVCGMIANKKGGGRLKVEIELA